jgi:hypothetical protein
LTPGTRSRRRWVTVADAEVFPELKGILKQLYDEDADWAEVLPGIIDAEIQAERLDRRFAERLPASRSEVDPTHLQPLKRALVYEVPADWEPPFLADGVPAELVEARPSSAGPSCTPGPMRRQGCWSSSFATSSARGGAAIQRSRT